MRIVAFGEIDELNSLLGLARSEATQEPIDKALARVQSTLFTMGAQLAASEGKLQVERINASHIEFLERQIDAISETIPPLKTFILPGGSKLAATLHFARSVCRRAERSVVHLKSLENDGVDDWILIYLNRLSDFLFVMARLSNRLARVEDVAWTGDKPSASSGEGGS